MQQGLTQDDFDMYYEIWERFDEEATEYIPLDKLYEFCDTLEEPLRIPQPNHYKLVFLDITICEDDRVHCLDILDALTKNFLGTAGDPSADLGEIKKQPDRADYVPVSSLLRRQREQFCARVIQRLWRNKTEKRKLARGEREGIAGSVKPGGEQTIIRVETVAEEDEDELAEDERQTNLLLGLDDGGAGGGGAGGGGDAPDGGAGSPPHGAGGLHPDSAYLPPHLDSTDSQGSGSPPNTPPSQPPPPVPTQQSSKSSASSSSESSSSESSSPTDSKKPPGADKDGDGKSDGGDDRPPPGSGGGGGGGAGPTTDRTVELYPESGVVA